MWSDNETTLDLIGFKVHSDLIRSVITKSKLLPVAIGLFGDWGSGKSSVMRMLEHDLNPDNCENPEEKAKYEKIACLYFNGWLFEGYDDAKSAIISSILLQLGEHERFGPKIQNKVASLLKSVNWMRIARLGLKEVALPALSAYLSGGITIVPTLAKATQNLFSGEEKEDEDSENNSERETKEEVDWEELIKNDKTPAGPLDVRSFRDRFAKMLQDTNIEFLVVLIDDLDRCSPERIVDNLEAIKLFLNVDRTAFVIGADPRIVRHAIAVRYNPEEIQSQYDQGEAETRLVDDYLEKLIQVPYHLPRLSPSEIETYMVLLFCLRDLDDGDFSTVLAACNSQRAENRYSVFHHADVEKALEGRSIPKGLSQSLNFCTSAAPLVTEGLKGNPRQVKRFLNAFVLRKELASVANLENIRDDVLVKLMILEYGHPKEFRQLFEWQASQDGFPKEIQAIEKAVLPPDSSLEKEDEVKSIAPQWANTFMMRWIAMEPALSDVDLRDYFWIVRDRMELAFPGLSMVPPTVRRLFDDLMADKPRGKIIQDIRESHEDEQIILLDLLEQRILRNPDQKFGYDILRNLVEEEIDGSIDTLVEVFNECSETVIPPAVGMDLVTLRQSKPGLADSIDPIIDKLGSTDSMVGRAIKSTRKQGQN